MTSPCEWNRAVGLRKKFKQDRTTSHTHCGFLWSRELKYWPERERERQTESEREREYPSFNTKNLQLTL